MTVFGGIAELEQPLILSRTQEGREAAQECDGTFGRPEKLKPDQKNLVRELVKESQTISPLRGHSMYIQQQSIAASIKRGHYRISCCHQCSKPGNDAKPILMLKPIGTLISPWKIARHPEFSRIPKDVISLDYDMYDGKATIKTRKLLLYFTLKPQGLDTEPSVRALQDQQIVLLAQKPHFEKNNG